MNENPQTATGTDNDPILSTYIVEHVDEAIEKGWVVPYYQPVVRTLTGQLCGFEALARWEDPTYGVLAPAAFIGPLEEARLIHKLDSCIIYQVCRDYRAWSDVGDPVVPISFNLSRLDFDLCDIFAIVEKAVHDYEVPRRMLNIEITESVMGINPSFMITMMRRFHDVGYQVWMDDFGAGYSTLNVLKDFDFDELKIDMEFLRRFGDKAKTIIASVVDMAKKLGIQTLAEGVETEEHRVFLKRVGCEKMQGYLFGPPRPYSHKGAEDLRKTIGVESVEDRLYYGAIGFVNTLSLSERDFQANAKPQDYVTSMPLAIVEYDGSTFDIINANHVFRDTLRDIGIPSLKDALEMVNSPNRQLARSMRHAMETIAQERFARLDFIFGGTTCIIRARYITESGKRTALLVSIDTTMGMSERKRLNRMDEAMRVLYSIYEHVDIIHLDDEFAEPVFSNAGFHEVYDRPTIWEAVYEFCEAEIFPDDRSRYVEYMDPSTMKERLRQSSQGFLVDFFRTRSHGGDYTWKQFGLIPSFNQRDNEVVLCIRETDEEFDALLQRTYDKIDGSRHDLSEVDLRVTDGSLWRAMENETDLGLFWKDRERRFLGANKKFLEYYGLDSIDQILGKTDEDMHWHVDPLPFMEDELRVLNEGTSTSDVPGQCIVRGQIRDIAASKRPIYRNGRIVGLVGFFVDVEDRYEHADGLHNTAMVDPVTETLNYTGLEAATARYVDAFRKHGIDFGIVEVDIDSFKRINDEFGYKAGDKVLRRVADELRNALGKDCSIGHVYADRFVVIAQCSSSDDLQRIGEQIERRLVDIAEVDGVRCTLYAFTSFALFSECSSTEDMKLTSRERMHARKRWERARTD